MTEELKKQLRAGYETAYIDGSLATDITYKPGFISNNPREGRKVISTIEDELMKCDSFQISVAFITESGITPLLQTLSELEHRGIPGKILTTDYLCFSEPKALRKLHELKNLTIKMYDTEASMVGFHTKGYIFKKQEVYRIIIGSSNITNSALTSNREWNTKLVSTEQGEVTVEIVKEFEELWNSKYALDFEQFIDNYSERYSIVKRQRQIAKQEDIVSLEKYSLQPNSMQERFVAGLRNIVSSGEDRALLISATGTGKTYASAFGMRELGFKRVLFIVHRNQLAVQAMKSYERVFSNTVTMGIVSGRDSLMRYRDKDYIFAMVQTLSKDENIRVFEPDAFDAIVLDEYDIIGLSREAA